MRRWIFLALLTLAIPALAQTPMLQPLAASDIPALLKPPAHGTRIIAIWALDCAYCEANMQTLAKVVEAQPDRYQLVTVATDRYALHAQITARLTTMHMNAYPARAYAEASPEHLNFLLNPQWGGETPRTELIRADGSRLGFSGELTPAQLRRIR
jgi:hypothetical protein